MRDKVKYKIIYRASVTGILSKSVVKKKQQNKEQEESPYTRNVAGFDKHICPNHDIICSACKVWLITWNCDLTLA